MTKRKQNLMKRYITEMLMRLDGWQKDEEAKAFVEFDLEAAEDLERARDALTELLGELIYFQEG